MDKKQLIQFISETSELLYQQKITEGYEKLNQVIQELTTYVTQITDVEQQNELLVTLKETLSAMEEKDTTLLADLLQYELIEKL